MSHPEVEDNQSSAMDTILTCTRWQVEEAADSAICPYRYFCESRYPGDYPWMVGFLVLLFASFCFVSTMVFTVKELDRTFKDVGSRIGGGSGGGRSWKRKYLVPSGPFLLPLVLLSLATGRRTTNAVFPLHQFGPAVLQLFQTSALAFRNEADSDVRYAVLEASTMSGLLHASLYLDAIIMPYYTGLEAMRGARFTGECPSCMCRATPLIAGGSPGTYRGMSITTLAIIFVLCSRMLCRIYGEEGITLATKWSLEGTGWLLLARDSAVLLGRMLMDGIAAGLLYGGLFLLIFINIFLTIYRILIWLEATKFHPKSNPAHCNTV